MTVLSCWFILFFFSSRRRHTRCLSDWSSDVCSSDLTEAPQATPIYANTSLSYLYLTAFADCPSAAGTMPILPDPTLDTSGTRSEERRVGKECRSGGAAYR